MKRLPVEVGYHGSIVLLSMAFLILGWILRELIMPMRPGPTGHYGGDGFLVGLISVSLSFYLTDVIVGTIFHATGLTERRRSIFHHRRPRGAG